MPLSSLAQRILLRTAKLLNRKDHWIKGRGWAPGEEGPATNYCMLGALSRATIEIQQQAPLREWHPDKGHMVKGEYHVAADEVRRVIENHIHRRNRGNSIPIPGFNDSPYTTHEDVKEVMCAAVKEEVLDESE